MLSRDALVSELAAVVQDREGNRIPLAVQQLSLGGKRLESDCTLHDYDIPNESTISLTIRPQFLLPGCWRMPYGHNHGHALRVTAT